MALLVDTGVLYALADLDDDWHVASRQFLEERAELLVAPGPVLPEVTYLLRSRLGAAAERGFVESVAAGDVAVENAVRSDYPRVAEIMGAYPEIGFVDAAVVAIAERLGLSTLLTTDRRHFSTIRPRHVKSFELVP